MKVEYVLEQATVDFDADMDPEARDMLTRARALTQQGRVGEAVALLPPMTFTFDPASCDEPGDDYFESQDPVTVALDDTNSSVQLSMDGDNLMLSVTVTFDIDTLEDIEPEDLESWLNTNGGWFACEIGTGFGYTPEDSGELTVIL